MIENPQPTLTVIDPANPHALASVLPLELATLVMELPKELLIQDETSLSTLVTPSEQQKRVKLQFWDEYDTAQKEDRPLVLSKISWGVCTREYLLEFVKIKRNLAWLISPKPSYRIRVAELIEKGLDRVDEILSMRPTGKNASAEFTLQLSALRMLDMRRHGGYTQRQETKSMHVHKTLHGDAPDPQALANKSIEELEQDIKRLDERVVSGKNMNGALLRAIDVIDITPGEPVAKREEPTT